MSTVKLRKISSLEGTETLNVDSSGRILMPARPAFDASPTSTIAHNTNPIPMPHVSVNNGNCFDSSTGTFTAPITGTYYFYMHFLGGTATTVFRFYAMFNGSTFDETHCRLASEAGNDYNHTSLTFIKPMNKNQTMAVKMVADDGASSAYADGNPGYQRFGGFLLY